MHDPHVRYPHDPGPVVRRQMLPRRKKYPGRIDVVRPALLRYTLADTRDPDLCRLRADAVNSGEHLFVCLMGDTGVKQLVEAYYPDGIREAYAARQLAPHQKMDYEMGRLVVVNELFEPWVGEIDPRRIEEINRNARNVHSELKRTRASTYHKKAIHNAEEEAAAPAIKEWSDWYEDAYNETEKFALGKPRVSAVTHRP